jgi:hypothetical protein
MASIPVPPILTTLVGRIALAVPARARTTFLELLLGAAASRSGHVTDAILTSGVSRGWTTYFWFLERGRWSWLQVWQALLGVLRACLTSWVRYLERRRGGRGGSWRWRRRPQPRLGSARDCE